MNDYFRNRLGMYDTSLGTVNDPKHKPIWQGQPPLQFGKRVAAAETAVQGLHDLAQQHGITPLAIAAQEKEVDDFAAYITTPQQKIAKRKSLTAAFSPSFTAVEKIFESLDRFIKQYRHTEEGRAFIAAYQASRIIRDLGHRSSPDDSESDEEIGDNPES